MDDSLGALKRISPQCKSVEHHLGVSEHCKECVRADHRLRPLQVNTEESRANSYRYEHNGETCVVLSNTLDALVLE